uniref:Uncharacterized protein n=1 Tax=viral metagenome TaxID=1070528 RepID=A0A6M3JJC5_9ZZZZ
MTYRDIALEYFPGATDDFLEYVIWNETGYPCFWCIPEDGANPVECFRKQLVEARGRRDEWPKRKMVKIMSEFKRCSNCGRYDFVDKHICPPEWQVYIPDWHDPDEPPERGFGHDQESVAEGYVEEHFSDLDYPEEVEIWVRKDSSCAWDKFSVTIEQVPSFSATKIKG